MTKTDWCIKKYSEIIICSNTMENNPNVQLNISVKLLLYHIIVIFPLAIIENVRKMLELASFSDRICW